MLLDMQLRSQQREFDAVKASLETQLSEKISERDSFIARQVGLEAELADQDSKMGQQRQQIRDLEAKCAELEQEKGALSERAMRLSDELSDLRVAVEFDAATSRSDGGEAEFRFV